MTPPKQLELRFKVEHDHEVGGIREGLHTHLYETIADAERFCHPIKEIIPHCHVHDHPHTSHERS